MNKNSALSETENFDAAQLMQNGLAFLLKARADLESDPKFSIVNFWHGVEILMKVPLVNHNWRLIVRKRKDEQDITREQFTSGDFSSINFQETCRLLQSELGIKLDDRSRSFFQLVQQHRNRVVHFYHCAVSEQALDELRSEQADAWFALSRLITNEWRKVFSTEQWSEINIINHSLLRSNTYYAAAKFRFIKPRLKLSDHHFQTCKICLQQSYLVTRQKDIPVFNEKCEVCNHIETYISVACPECSHISRLKQDDTPFDCPECHHSQDRFSLLDEDDSLPEDYHLSNTPAGCCECDGYDTICKYCEGYLCTVCLGYFDSLNFCEHCSYSSTQVPEFSSMCGCGFCDGHRETWDLYDD